MAQKGCWVRAVEQVPAYQSSTNGSFLLLPCPFLWGTCQGRHDGSHQLPLEKLSTDPNGRNNPAPTLALAIIEAITHVLDAFLILACFDAIGYRQAARDTNGDVHAICGQLEHVFDDSRESSLSR